MGNNVPNFIEGGDADGHIFPEFSMVCGYINFFGEIDNFFARLGFLQIIVGDAFFKGNAAGANKSFKYI
ncbi:hypothetical protein D3C80_2200370 [compost metagenome]